MKNEKETQKPTKKRQSTKTLENPETMRLSDMLLHHAPEVSAKFPNNRPQKSPQPSHFRAVFHHNPSLPTSVKIPFTSP